MGPENRHFLSDNDAHGQGNLFKNHHSRQTVCLSQNDKWQVQGPLSCTARQRLGRKLCVEGLGIWSEVQKERLSQSNPSLIRGR